MAMSMTMVTTNHHADVDDGMGRDHKQDGRRVAVIMPVVVPGGRVRAAGGAACAGDALQDRPGQGGEARSGSSRGALGGLV